MELFSRQDGIGGQFSWNHGAELSGGVFTGCENALGKLDVCRSQATAVECMSVRRPAEPA
jgi:hypothetical protein